MSHFAEVNNGVVTKVIVAEQDFIDTLDNSKQWIQTSYNTKGGVNTRTGIPIRKNYAGIGYTYDKIKDGFISPKPFPSWILNEDTCIWESPIPKPNDEGTRMTNSTGTFNKHYFWNEKSHKWEI